MTNAAALLRMLEPAVRPVSTPSKGAAGQLPIEQRSFDSLLAEVKQETASLPQVQSMDQETTTMNPAETETKADPLMALRQFQAIDNASLRGLMEQ